VFRFSAIILLLAFVTAPIVLAGARPPAMADEILYRNPLSDCYHTVWLFKAEAGYGEGHSVYRL
jgi:hypothetical protein